MRTVGLKNIEPGWRAVYTWRMNVDRSLVERFRGAWAGVAGWINRVDLRVVILLVLVVNCLPYRGIHGNEEVYLSYAKQYFNPDWVQNDFHLFDFPLYQRAYTVFSGLLLKFLTIEQLVFWGRLGLCMLLAFPLARLFRRAGASALEVIVLLQVFYLPHQFFFANEWIFLTWEPKAPAYVLIFWALNAVLERRFVRCALIAALATYLHVLAAGWFFAAVLLHMLYARVRWREIAGSALLYAVCVAPWACLLYWQVIWQTPASVEGIGTDWIYAQFRHPHHAGLFVTPTYFFNAHAVGVLASACWCVVCIVYFLPSRQEWIRRLTLLNLAMLTIILVFVPVALFDRGGVILKYQPYRLSPLSVFLIMLQVAAVLRTEVITSRFRTFLPSLLLAAVLPFSFKPAAYAARGWVRVMFEDPPVTDLSTLGVSLQELTAPGSVFMFVHYPTWDKHYGFYRYARRARFANFKWIPQGTVRTHEWYARICEQEKVNRDFEYLFEVRARRPVDYVISPDSIEHARLQPIYQNPAYYVYRIVDDPPPVRAD